MEDESIIALKLKQDIESLNYEVVSICHSAESTLSTISENEVDIVLMDIRLKGEINGIELAKMIQKFKEYPVLFISAFSDDELVNQAKEVFPLGYIQKPFQKNDLKIALNVGLYKYDMQKKLRESEAKIRQLNHELEFRVKTRTDQLHSTNLKLIHSKKDLESLISTFYHEIQEPLRLIQNYHALLFEDLDSNNIKVGAENRSILTSKIHLANSILSQFKYYTSLIGSTKPNEQFDLTETINLILQKYSRVGLEVHNGFNKLGQNIKINGVQKQIITLFEKLLDILIQGYSYAKITISVALEEGKIYIDISNIEKRLLQQKEPQNIDLTSSENIELMEGFNQLTCKKIVENHGGHLKVISVGRRNSLFSFNMPYLDQ